MLNVFWEVFVRIFFILRVEICSCYCNVICFLNFVINAIFKVVS